MGVHIHLRVQQAKPDTGHHSRARPRATGQRLARTALEHPQTHLTTVHHLQKTGVYTRRKSGMGLDGRAPLQYRGRVDITDQQNGVGVAHGHG